MLNPQNPQSTPTTQDEETTVFFTPDGQPVFRTEYIRITGPTPHTDIARQVHKHKILIACGCFFPDATIVGVCPVCAEEVPNPHICQAHYVVCRCGQPRCWKHSHLLEDSTRLCERCYFRHRYGLLRDRILGGTRGFCKWLWRGPDT